MKTKAQICNEVSQIRNIDEVKHYKICFKDRTTVTWWYSERQIIMDDDIDCYYELDDDED